MSGFVGNNNCQICIACFNNCTACPAHVCARRTMYFNNLDRINKQVRMDSSLSLLKRRSLNVSRQVGQSANPKMLGQAGGPGDLIHAVGKTNACDQKHCNTVTYRLPILQRRTANKGKIGVDKKHGSYARYLARRVGGEIRKEKMPVIRNRTAFIHQPRNRTGTAAACVGSRACGKFQYRPPSKFLLRARTAFKCNSAKYQQAAPQPVETNNVIFPRWADTSKDTTIGHGVKPLFGPYNKVGGQDCCSEECCENRIPGGPSMGKYEFKCDSTHNCSRNPQPGDVTGLLGNNTQCVPSGNCSCCPKV